MFHTELNWTAVCSLCDAAEGGEWTWRLSVNRIKTSFTCFTFAERADLFESVYSCSSGTNKVFGIDLNKLDL